jgi:hypothetical protein
LKLSKAPNMRTVIIAVLAFILIGTAVDALAREIRIFPANTAIAPWAGICAGGATACDLVRAAAGLAPLGGPDAGVVPAPGDVLVLAPGNYVLVAPVAPPADGSGAVVIPGVVGYNGVAGFPPMNNLTIRSSNGANVTIINGSALLGNNIGAAAPFSEGAVLIIGADGVTIGGPGADQGVSIISPAFAIAGRILAGIQIGADPATGDTLLGAPYPVVNPAGAGLADENITIQNNIIRDNTTPAIGATGTGIRVVTPAPLENFKIVGNTIIRNEGQGILFDVMVGALGRGGPDRNMVIAENTFDTNTADHIAFFNNGEIEQLAILKNQINRSTAGSGIIFNHTAGVRDSIIAENIIQQNAGFGIFFFNPQRLENVQITGNKGATPDQGITGNGLAGIAFWNGEIRESLVENNTVNSNGLQGIDFLRPTGQRVGDLTLNNNNIRQNALGGVRMLNFSDYERSTVSNNTIRNNGVLAGPLAPGFAVIHTTQRIDNIAFSNNDVRENGLIGVLLFTTAQDISSISFSGDQFIKNRSTGLMVVTNTVGEIAQIRISNVKANENEGAQFLVGFPFPGSGIELISFQGDITDISVTSSEANNNGMFGTRIEARGATPGDVTTINVKDSRFSFNGTRAPVGMGTGLFIRGQSVRDVVIDPTTANNNNDHGVQVTSTRDILSVKVENSEFSNNDRNFDTVGNGLSFSAQENLDRVEVRNNKVNSNNIGVEVRAQDRIGRNVTIEKNPEINNNRNAGIDLFGGRDFTDVTISENVLDSNAFGIRFDVKERGSDIVVTKNKIKGANGTGVGILMDATGVEVTQNSIRNNATGIIVRKVRDNKINKNNIARNENFGVDATALNPGEKVDATKNWWGEPSGPKHSSNPQGIGDRVSDKVDFSDFLKEPAFKTEATFTVESLEPPTFDVTVGESVTFKYKVKNTGTEEDTQEVTVTIKDGLGNVVNQFSRQVTVNPAGFRQDEFSFIFQTPGEYTVTVKTANDSKSVKGTVAGGAACLPFALDTNKNKVLDDAEIITAIDLWVKNGDVPGCSPPLKISDTQIIQLIDLWVKGSQLTVPLGGKFTPASVNPTTTRFATLSTSVRAVRPGDSFVVTVNVDAKDGISGLLIAQSLPTGWSAKPIQLSGAYYKASENKWLWLNAKGTVSVSYEVTVPATAQPGLYTIAGRVKAAVPGIESELQPLTVEVLGAPVALAVKAITLSQQPVRTSGAYFAVEGVGIAQTTVRVFSMTGKLVFSQTAQGNVVPFSAASELANGVYLYVVTVQGADGQTVTSKIAKLVVLK